MLNTHTHTGGHKTLFPLLSLKALFIERGGKAARERGEKAVGEASIITYESGFYRYNMESRLVLWSTKKSPLLSFNLNWLANVLLWFLSTSSFGPRNREKTQLGESQSRILLRFSFSFSFLSVCTLWGLTAGKKRSLNADYVQCSFRLISFLVYLGAFRLDYAVARRFLERTMAKTSCQSDLGIINYPCKPLT